jgi:hypothetical protein
MLEGQKIVNADAINNALKISRAKKAAALSESSEMIEVDSRPGRKRLSDEERALRDAARNKERLEKRAQRETLRASKKAAREADRSSKIPHMAKVDKQAKNLPNLSNDAQEALTNLLENFDETTITSLVAHLQFELRRKATMNASNTHLQVGDLVRITSADGPNAKWVGHLAQVLKVQRIRCYVQPVGTERSVYLFSSNVEHPNQDEIETVEISSQEENVVEQQSA